MSGESDKKKKKKSAQPFFSVSIAPPPMIVISDDDDDFEKPPPRRRPPPPRAAAVSSDDDDFEHPPPPPPRRRAPPRVLAYESDDEGRPKPPLQKRFKLHPEAWGKTVLVKDKPPGEDDEPQPGVERLYERILSRFQHTKDRPYTYIPEPDLFARPIGYSSIWDRLRRNGVSSREVTLAMDAWNLQGHVSSAVTIWMIPLLRRYNAEILASVIHPRDPKFNQDCIRLTPKNTNEAGGVNTPTVTIWRELMKMDRVIMMATIYVPLARFPYFGYKPEQNNFKAIHHSICLVYTPASRELYVYDSSRIISSRITNLHVSLGRSLYDAVEHTTPSRLKELQTLMAHLKLYASPDLDIIDNSITIKLVDCTYQYPSDYMGDCSLFSIWNTLWWLCNPFTPLTTSPPPIPLHSPVAFYDYCKRCITAGYLVKFPEEVSKALFPHGELF